MCQLYRCDKQLRLSLELVSCASTQITSPHTSAAGPSGRMMKSDASALLEALPSPAKQDLLAHLAARGERGFGRGRVVLFGTVFSGGDLAVPCAMALAEALSECGATLTFQHVFSCESNEMKQRFIQFSQRPAQLFPDAASLPEPCPECCLSLAHVLYLASL